MRSPFARRWMERGSIPALLGAGLGWPPERQPGISGSAVRAQGQVAVIEGASRGLGLPLAREFARNGCPPGPKAA